MIISFLRSTIRDVAVVVDLADVAGVQPAVGVERLGGLVGHVAVAGHHDVGRARAARRRRRACSSTPGAGSPTVPILISPGGLTAPAPQVSDMPQISASGTPMAWKNTEHLARRRRRADVHRDRLVEPEHRPQPARTASPRPPRRSAASSSGTGSPACSSSTLRGGRLQPARGLRSASSPCSRMASRPALSFSQMRGTAKNQVGLTAGR